MRGNEQRAVCQLHDMCVWRSNATITIQQDVSSITGSSAEIAGLQVEITFISENHWSPGGYHLAGSSAEIAGLQVKIVTKQQVGG